MVAVIVVLLSAIGAELCNLYVVNMEKQTKSLDCGRDFDFPGGGRVANYRSFCSHIKFRKCHGSVPVNFMLFRNDVQKIGMGYFYHIPNNHMRVKKYKVLNTTRIHIRASSVSLIY